MAPHPRQTAEHGDERDVETDGPSRADGAGRTVRKLSRNGSIAAVAGGTLLARALRSPRRASRAVVQGAAGAALVALGVRQWRRRRSSEADGLAVQVEDHEASASDEAAVSSEATAHAERSDVVHQDETNPRGTSGEPEVETETGPDEGSVQFTTEGASEPRAEPDLGGDAPEDPRLDDPDDVGDGADADGADEVGDGADTAGGDDGAVEVDLSEASMADEASEATGPAPEQAQPTSTEETEPEPTPDEDASHVDSDVSDGPDGETGADPGADGESESVAHSADEDES